MLLELHIIQNFAPSNLNRDDTGSPKSCEFGGYRRARISSQSIKRAIRGEFDAGGLLPAEQRATRSKRFVENIATRLADGGRDKDAALAVAEAGLALLDIKLAKEQKTEYLLFLGEREVAAIAGFCEAQWDSLAAPTEKKSKKDSKDDATKKLGKELAVSLDGGKAADLALFGRMLADLPERNIDAASQVAHAISTHQVADGFDYYTAVDDLKPNDTAGADMIGTVEFNSACYYRYANIDIDQLRKNLGNDDELVTATLRAFLIASRDAIPTGKQNSFAARNAPAFFCTVVRDRGAWSLANAFANPVRVRRDGGLVDTSIKQLDTHWGELVKLYGAPAGAQLAVAALGQPALEHLKPHEVDTFDALLERTLDAARAPKAG
jgi:CRISPR system Cascade subunit CasC